MERQLGPVSLEWNSTQPADVDRLIEWKCRKYHGMALLFSDPTARGIVKELAASKGDDCRGVVSVLFAGARPTAVHLGLLGPRSLAGWFMSYDPALSRFAPGMTVWNPLAKAAGERGIGQIDLGAGQDTYKFALPDNSYVVTGGGVWSAGRRQPPAGPAGAFATACKDSYRPGCASAQPRRRAACRSG